MGCGTKRLKKKQKENHCSNKTFLRETAQSSAYCLTNFDKL